MISFIIPTYQEVKNLPTLLEGIASEMSQAKLDYEVWIMDDVSEDGSEEVIAKYSQWMPVKIMVRHNKVRGLSESVIDGLYEAKGDYCVVMDADLSHPISAVPAMIEKLQNKSSDFVLGSRYIADGTLPKDWGVKRWLNSKIATMLAYPLVKVNDPMSGFFALARANLPDINTLNPIGYKIALEILVKGNFKAISEHPIGFVDRTQGESKLNLKEQLNYLRHLRRLYQYRYATLAELVQFAVIGSWGFIVDLLFYFSLQSFGVQHQVARAISFWPAVTSNWLLNRTITFNQRTHKSPLRQWVSFVCSSLVGFTVNTGSYILLTNYIDFFNQFKVIGLMIGVILGMGFNFLFSNLFVFQDLRAEKGVHRINHK